MTNKELLYKPFDNIPSRRGRGGVYSYVKWQDVADRMNQVFGNNWSSCVEYQEIIGDNIIMRVRVIVNDPETSRLSYQEGFGGAPNDDRLEAGNSFKSAYSKALKDACKKWGVGLFLEEEDGDTTPNIPSGYMGKETAPEQPTAPTSDGLPTPPSVSMGNAPPPPTPATPEPAPQPPVEEEMPVEVPPVEQTGNIPPFPTAFPEKPAEKESPAQPPVGDKPPVVSSLPTPPPLGGSAPSKSTTLPEPKAQPIDNGDVELISNVQKAALHSILNIKGVEYEPLVKEALEAKGIHKTPIPPPDMLTYEEAVHVVKYGNDKFRRR
jgi:hypothetical protein